MGKPGCAVFGCKPSKTDGRHRFIDPHKNVGLFEKWLQSTGNRQIFNLSYDYIYQHYRVCSKHFMESDFGPNRILKKDAYPKNMLPGTISETRHESGIQDIAGKYSFASPSGDTQQKVPVTRHLLCQGTSETTIPCSEARQELRREDIAGNESLAPSSNSMSSAKDTEGSYGNNASTPAEFVSDCERCPSREALDAGVSPLNLPIENDCASVGDIMTRQAAIATPAKPGKGHLLHSLSIRRVADLTPRKRILYESAKQFKKMYKVESRRKLNFRRRFREAVKFSESDNFETITANLNTITKKFFLSQIRCSKKKLKGRRFSLEDKLTALALFKKSGAAYNFLSRIFFLPSRTTLTKLLRRIPIRPGMNKSVFDGLRNIGRKLDKFNKYCVLLFDEMAISPQLHFNQHLDAVDGFEHFGDYRTNKICDHVQVFMLRGIKKRWKQPVLFQFVNSAVRAPQIIKSIKDIIRATSKAGFTVVGTICDQGANNVSAIKRLVEDTKGNYLREGRELRHFIFEIDGRIVVPLFDTPHLLKGVRNNLISKDIFLKINGVLKSAKWQDIFNAWLLDSECGHFRVMPKMTENHVNPQKINKMKVATSAQVFSHQVSSANNIMARSGFCEGDVKLTSRAVETAEFLKFFDSLFDSVNGSGVKSPEGKNFKCQVDLKEQIHVGFWRTAIETVSSMYCLDEKGRKSVPVTFHNWEITLRNFIYLCERLRELGFKVLKPRFLNQDPLENFFGQIRQRGSRYVNPTSSAFQQFFKSLLINNLIGKHSVGANCEDDKSDILLPLQNFFSQRELHGEDDVIQDIEIPDDFSTLRKIEENALAHVGGYIIHVKALLPSCRICRYNVLRRDTEESSFLQFVEARELGGLNKRRLMYINGQFFQALVKMYNITHFVVKNYPEMPCLLKATEKCVRKNVDFDFVTCEHSEIVLTKIIISFCKLTIHTFFNGANNILSGRDQRPLSPNCGTVYQAARSWFLKRRARK